MSRSSGKGQGHRSNKGVSGLSAFLDRKTTSSVAVAVQDNILRLYHSRL